MYQGKGPNSGPMLRTYESKGDLLNVASDWAGLAWDPGLILISMPLNANTIICCSFLTLSIQGFVIRTFKEAMVPVVSGILQESTSPSKHQGPEPGPNPNGRSQKVGI